MSLSVIVTESGNYYYVRVMRRGKMYAKCFKQLRAARRHERELLQRLGPPASQKGKPKRCKLPNTGEKRIVRTLARRPKASHPVFRVYYRTPEGEPRSTEISIARWGEEKALALAKAKRRQMDRRQLGRD